MEISITPYGMKAMREAFERAPEVARRELLAAMTEATLLIQADLQGAWPKHKGNARNSIMADAFATPTGVLGVVESASPVVHFNELGTTGQPRKFPPLEPLVEWVEDKLGLSDKEAKSAAFAIQTKIGLRGTKGKNLMRDAVGKRRDNIKWIFEQAAGRMLLSMYQQDRGKA